MALTTVKGAVLNRGVNVKDYGAIGDGVTDDTAAIQAAINTGAVDILLPGGTYNHTGLTLATSGQRIRGASKTTTLEYTGSGTAVTVSDDIDDVMLENIDFYSTSETVTMFDFTGRGNYWVFTNCKFRKSYHSTDLSKGITFSRSAFSGWNGGHRFINCLFKNWYRAVDIPNDTAEVTELQFFSCEWNANKTAVADVQSGGVTGTFRVFGGWCDLPAVNAYNQFYSDNIDIHIEGIRIEKNGGDSWEASPTPGSLTQIIAIHLGPNSQRCSVISPSLIAYNDNAYYNEGIRNIFIHPQGQWINYNGILVENGNLEGSVGTLGTSSNYWSESYIADGHLSGIDQFTIRQMSNVATPTVQYGRYLRTGGTTTITDFADGVEGQVITILAEHAVTITHGTNIFLQGFTNFTMANRDTLTLILKSDGNWYEVNRMDVS